MQRRNFLKLSGLGAGAAVTGGSLTGFLVSCSGCKKEHHRGLMTKPVMVTEGDFSRLLSFPPQAGANQTLTAQVTTANLRGINIPVLGYQPNSLLGPSFRINKGDAVNILLQNNLSEHTNIHWHGLKIPALMDGHPDQLANAGGTFRYLFTVNQRAGLSWYHPHPHEITGKQVFQGLAGLFIINDAEEAALNLPSGQYEIPLVIQDKRITNTGITYNPSMEEVMAGFMGGLMGAMTAFMLYNDHLILSMIIVFIISSIILFSLHFMIYKEMKFEERKIKEDHILTFVITFVLIILTMWLMVYGPRSGVFG